MKRLAFLIALAVAAPASAQNLAVIHAEAWTLDGPEPVRDATILIEGGKIVSVVPGGSVPSGATVIDARGKPVTAGLINAATQLGLVEVASATDTADQASRDPRGGPFDLSMALNGNSTLIDLARADGVTRAMIYPGASRTGPLSGEVAIARLRDGADIVDRANVAVFGSIGGGEWDTIGSRGRQWQALRKLLTDGRKPPESAGQHKRGKGAPEGPPRGRNREDPISDVAAGLIPLAIVTHRETDIRQAIALVRDLGIKVIIVGGTEAWRAADALAAAKIPVILDPQNNLPGSFDQLGTRQDNVAILSKAGVPIAFGLVGGAIHMTYNAGMALRSGAGIAVANGLPYVDALRAITVSPLTIWGVGGGGLVPGGEGDIVVWDGDPLEPSTNALAVIVEGKPVSIRTRQDLLAERYARMRR
ncbi:MAG: amidohydrolase [Sphingomonadales bacterium]|nr:MAG: amidohydrolase [Sphingomonadales bacterium]